MTVTTKVNGDATAGWVVEVHDGKNFGVYTPSVGTAGKAESAAVLAFNQQYGDQPTDVSATGPKPGKGAAIPPAAVPD